MARMSPRDKTGTSTALGCILQKETKFSTKMINGPANEVGSSAAANEVGGPAAANNEGGLLRQQVLTDP